MNQLSFADFVALRASYEAFAAAQGFTPIYRDVGDIKSLSRPRASAYDTLSALFTSMQTGACLTQGNLLAAVGWDERDPAKSGFVSVRAMRRTLTNAAKAVGFTHSQDARKYYKRGRLS